MNLGGEKLSLKVTQIEQIFQFMHVYLKLWVDLVWKLKQRCSEGTPTVEGVARRRTFQVLTRPRGYVFGSICINSNPTRVSLGISKQ